MGDGDIKIQYDLTGTFGTRYETGRRTCLHIIYAVGVYIYRIFILRYRVPE
jgi:hypothetical protein